MQLGANVLRVAGVLGGNFHSLLKGGAS
jgi:hypothetical protein